MTQTWNGYETMRRTTTPGLFPAGFAPARALDPIRAVDEAVRSVLAEMFGSAVFPPGGGRQTAKRSDEGDDRRGIGTELSGKHPTPVVPLIRPFGPPSPARGEGRITAEPVFADRLFGLRQAETLADGATIRVAIGTVVTPLARDLLKKKNVAIRLIGSAEVAASARGEWAFAIEDGPGWLVALRRSMLDGAGPWRELAPSVDDAVAWLGSGEGRGVLLVTTDGATAVWRACQASGVRAAFANEPADVQRATGTLGANLIVVDPAGKSIAWIKQLATSFRRAGAPKDPFAGGIGGTP